MGREGGGRGLLRRSSPSFPRQIKTLTSLEAASYYGERHLRRGKKKKKAQRCVCQSGPAGHGDSERKVPLQGKEKVEQPGEQRTVAFNRVVQAKGALVLVCLRLKAYLKHGLLGTHLAVLPVSTPCGL